MKLTTSEARTLIDMLKHEVLKQHRKFPEDKTRLEFDVVGTYSRDEFTVTIARKGFDLDGCTYQGRTKSENTVLMRLDVNPTSVHINPINGEKITGTHLHIYTEEYGDKYAIPFDVNNQNLCEICFTFFEKFNIIDMNFSEQQTIN